MKFFVLFLLFVLKAFPTSYASVFNPQDGEARVIGEQECSMSESMGPSSEEEGEVPIVKSKPSDTLLPKVGNAKDGNAKDNFTISMMLRLVSEIDINHFNIAGMLSRIPQCLFSQVFAEREVLLVDLTEVFDLRKSGVMLSIVSDLAMKNSQVRGSPSAMASLLLQLEWRLTKLAVSMEFRNSTCEYESFFRVGIMFKSLILESISETMPIVVRVFKNPLSYSLSKALKKTYAGNPQLKNNLKHLGQPGVFLDPVDLHDAINFFAKCSSDSTVRHADLSHKLASFIMASNLPEYYQQSFASDASAANYQVSFENFIVSSRDNNNPTSTHHAILTLFFKGHFEVLKYVHFFVSDLKHMFSIYMGLMSFETNIASCAELLKALPFLEDQMIFVKEIIDSYDFSDNDAKHLLNANLHFLSRPDIATIKVFEGDDHRCKCTVISGGKRTTLHISDLAMLFTQCFIKKHLMFKEFILNSKIVIVNGQVDKEVERLRKELINRINSTALGTFLLKVLPLLHDSNEVLYQAACSEAVSSKKYQNVDEKALQTALKELGELTKSKKHFRLEPNAIHLISFLMAVGSSSRKEFSLLRWIAQTNFLLISDEDAYQIMLNVFGKETINTITLSGKSKSLLLNRQCHFFLNSIILHYRSYSSKISNRKYFMQNSKQDLKDIELKLNTYVGKQAEQEAELKDLVNTFVDAWRRPDAQFFFGNQLSFQGVKCKDKVKKVMMVLMQDVLIELLLIYGIPTDKFFSSVQCVAHNFSIFSTKPEKYPSFIPCQEFEVPVNLELPLMGKTMQSFLRGDWIDSTEEPMQRMLSEAVKFKAVTQNLSEYLDLFTPYDYANSLFCIPSSARRLLGYAFVMRRCPMTIEDCEGDSKYLKTMSITSKMLNNIRFANAPVDLNPAQVFTALFGVDKDLTKLVTRTLSRYIPELDVANRSNLGRLSLLKTFCVKANIILPATEEEASTTLKFLKALIFINEMPEKKIKTDTNPPIIKRAEIKPPTSTETVSLNAKTIQPSVMKPLSSNGEKAKEEEKPVHSLPLKRKIKVEEKKTGKDDEKVIVEAKANKKKMADDLNFAKNDMIPLKEVLNEQTKLDNKKDVTSVDSNTKAKTIPKANNKKEKKVKESRVPPKKTTVSNEAEKELVVVEEEKKESEYFEIDYNPVRPPAKRRPNNNRGRKAKLAKTITQESSESIEKSDTSEPSEPIAHVERPLEVPEEETLEHVAEKPVEPSANNSQDIMNIVTDELQEFSTLQELQEPSESSKNIAQEISGTSSKENESPSSSNLSADSKSFVPSKLVPFKIKRKKLFDNIEYGYREVDLPFELYHHVELPRFLPLNTGYGTGMTHVIDRFSYSYLYVLMQDLNHADYIVMDFEFTGASLMGVKFNCIPELQVKVANKCSVLQTGIVLVSANGERSVWRIDASPPTNLFFTSYDFLVNTCNFCYSDYINRRLDVKISVVPFLAKAMEMGKQFVFHNAIYDVLHILKMMQPVAFAELVHGKVNGIEDVEAAVKEHLPNLRFLDTRSIYKKYFGTWLAAAQKEQGLDEIENPHSERLEELAYTLLPEWETEGIIFHDAAADALVTAKLFSFFMRNGCRTGNITESILGLVMNMIFSKERNDQE